jgi:hypothetical protein
MLFINGLEISGKDYFGRREDLSFIVRFNWKTSHHLKEAIQVLLASRLDDATLDRTGRRRSDLLDESELRQIRLHIASNPNTPPAVLSYLAKCDDCLLLERIAENPRTPQQILQRLAQSNSARVRAAVAENSNASADVLTVLGNDPDADVRYSLAENPHLPEELLLGLVEDANPYVSSRASQTLARLQSGDVITGEFGRRLRDESVWAGRN